MLKKRVFTFKKRYNDHAHTHLEVDLEKKLLLLKKVLAKILTKIWKTICEKNGEN
jgi:hypothetical protein